MRFSWQDHIINDEVMRRAGVALLSDMVADKRRRVAGHVFHLQKTRCQRAAGGREGGHRKHGDIRLRKI